MYSAMVTIYASGSVHVTELGKGQDVSADISITGRITVTSNPTVSYHVLVLSVDPTAPADLVTIS